MVDFWKGRWSVQRGGADERLWALQGGLAETGETVASAAARELWEEVGVHGKASRLLGAFASHRCQSRTNDHMDHAVFQVETDDAPAESAVAIRVGLTGYAACDPQPFLETAFTGMRDQAMLCLRKNQRIIVKASRCESWRR